ncbi:hypothetical protein D3C87_1229020 [compost metagenome]
MILNKLILAGILGLGSLQANASFDENARRYLSAQEIIQAMQVHFDVVDDCAKVNEVNAPLLGVNSAVTGSAIAPAPTQSTVQFVAGCVSKALDRITSKPQYPQAFAKLKILLGEELVSELSKNLTPFLDDNLALRLAYPWENLSTETREKIIARIVFVMLGSDDLINDFGLIDPTVLRAKLAAWAQGKPQLKTQDVIKFISVNLAVRDEFLSY